MGKNIGITRAKFTRNLKNQFVISTSLLFLALLFFIACTKQPTPAIVAQWRDIKIALTRMNKRLRVQQLYARTEQEINGLAERLARGEKFEDLARENLPDRDLAVEAGDLG